MNANSSAAQVLVEAPFRNPRKSSRKQPVAFRAAHKKTLGQYIAALAAGFLPVASYVVAHIEAPSSPYLYVLVVAALVYSAPTLVFWAKKWMGTESWVIYKAIGFTALLEGVMVFSHIQALNLTGLFILVLINSVTAYSKAGK